MLQSNYIHSEITDKIIKCFYAVYNELGYGFLEKVYERALILELIREGFQVTSQKCFKVYYKGDVVGMYIPDILVDGLVVIEVKAVVTMHNSHEDQLKNALRATDFEVGLLFNFGVVPQLKRKVYANEFKKHKNHPRQT